MERQLVAIVDDDKSIRNATQDLLNAAGYSTATFDSAESFLNSTHLAQTGCLVTDMRMPGMTGLELHQELLARRADIPTIIMTAHPEEMRQARAREAGITCYLIKPFEPDELLGCIRSAFAKDAHQH